MRKATIISLLAFALAACSEAPGPSGPDDPDPADPQFDEASTSGLMEVDGVLIEVPVSELEGVLTHDDQLSAIAAVSAELSAVIRVIYPTGGQPAHGTCWQGLTIDSEDNLYPIGTGRVYRMLPDGSLVNGLNDQDFFAEGGTPSFWAELDEPTASFYKPGSGSIWTAPFSEGAAFSRLISGTAPDPLWEGITVGKGPTAGSVFATEHATNRISRVTLFPLGLNLFATGAAFVYPMGMAAAPDGSIYVSNLGGSPRTLVKVTPDGMATTFASTAHFGTRAVAVDRDGKVYWSTSSGFQVYQPDGTLLGILPGPPDRSTFSTPMGAAFDSNGDLYFVANGGCKKIYKYEMQPVDLILARVLDLVEAGVLIDGQGNSLTSKLEQAKVAIANDRPSAEHQLGAFINEVEGLMSGDNPVLTFEEGQPLIDAVQRLIDLLGLN